MFLSCCMSCLTANAQWSLKDVLNKETVGNLAGSLISLKVTAADLAGTWAFSKPACELESDDAAKKVGGSLVSSQIEAKLAELYAKAGISADRFSVTFNTDSSFVCQLKNRSIGGTFSVDGETGQISLKYGAVEGLAGAGSLNLYVRKTGDRIRLLFKADKLLEIVSAVANMTQNATVNAIGKVASAYDGMLLGCELTPKE